MYPANVGACALLSHLQYWTYYADCATLRGIPIVGDEGYHLDDWEGVQIRIRPDGRSTSGPPPTTATTTPGARSTGARTRGSTRSRTSPKRSAPATTTAGARRPTCCSSPAAATPATRSASPRIDRFTPGRRVHLIPFEPIAAEDVGNSPLRGQAPMAEARLAKPRGRRDGLNAPPFHPWNGGFVAGRLLRRHPQGAVEADRLAVEHRVGDDLVDQLRVLLGLAEARREGMPAPSASRASSGRAPPAAACRRGRGASSPRGPRARPCRAPPAGSCRRCRPSRPSRRPGRSGRRRRRSRRC